MSTLTLPHYLLYILCPTITVINTVYLPSTGPGQGCCSSQHKQGPNEDLQENGRQAKLVYWRSQMPVVFE